jgi:hypothetical protein
MNPERKTQIDEESLQTLKTLIHAALVCLDGIESGIKKQLDAAHVARTLSDRALHFVNAAIEQINSSGNAE